MLSVGPAHHCSADRHDHPATVVTSTSRRTVVLQEGHRLEEGLAIKPTDVFPGAIAAIPQYDDGVAGLERDRRPAGWPSWCS